MIWLALLTLGIAQYIMFPASVLITLVAIFDPVVKFHHYMSCWLITGALYVLGVLFMVAQ